MLSVIIPTKNEEHFLPPLLQSLKAQTMQPSEVIVADADSTDDTRNIAAKFGCRVVRGGLPGQGRNRGAEVAASPHLLFLDADVELRDKGFLETAMKEFMDRGLSVATCDLRAISETWSDHLLYRIYNFYARLVRPLLPHAPGFCIFVRKELHEKIGGFDERVLFCEDHDYAARAARVGRFGILPSVSVPVSVRRFERDGRMRTILTYLLAEAHLWTFGPVTHDLFRYRFEHKGNFPHASS